MELDYKKMYEDALERARQVHTTNIDENKKTSEYIFPELKESEDERIRKALIKSFEIHDLKALIIPGFSAKDVIAWLEKQSEQKPNPVPDWMPKFLDELRSKKNYFDWDEHKDIEGGILAIIKWMNPNYFNEKDGEQKHAEPKFKVGDWIINNDKRIAVPEQILKVEKYGYLTSRGYISFDKVKTDYHLWTIQDANDGDVLATKKGNPFIYDKDRYNNGLAYYYAGLDVNKELTLKSPHHMLTHFGELNSVSPATKEQRDLLFQKMHEAGYEWDAEKKKLKKIEQNSTDKIEPKFKPGDYIIEKDLNECGSGTIKEIKNNKYYFTNGTCIDIQEQDLWQLVKEHIEPKFKVGDWIVNKLGHVWHINSFDKKNYQVSNGDKYNYFPISKQDEMRLWTIQDAEDGDVLYFSDETIVIFKNLYNATTFHSYCHIEDELFVVSKDDMPDWWEGKGFQPATKEQHDLLFQKMKEAGYEWDDEKKELKKIDNTPNMTEALRTEYEKGRADAIAEIYKSAKWSERDLHIINNIYDFVAENTIDINRSACANECLSWLKSLKDRVLPQPKQEWSEEDEKINNALYQSIDFLCLKSFGFSEDEVCEWIKSLKDRVQLHSKQEWSEEDEKMLEEVCSNIEFAIIKRPTLSKELGEKQLNWLKSLKPQKH